MDLLRGQHLDCQGLLTVNLVWLLMQTLGTRVFPACSASCLRVRTRLGQSYPSWTLQILCCCLLPSPPMAGLVPHTPVCCVMMQSQEAGRLKEQSNQVTVVAARTLSELGKVFHLMGECSAPGALEPRSAALGICCWHAA